MSSALFLVTALSLPAQLPQEAPPDMSDILRGADQHPMIDLLLDVSCSMADSAMITPCRFYANTVENSNPALSAGQAWLNKNQMMEAALTGCRSADDGVIDRWNDRVGFAIRYFGDSSAADGTSFRANFDSTPAELDAAVKNTSADGNTPMSAGLVYAGRDFSRLTTGPRLAGQVSTRSCRRNFVLLLSDGQPNGNPERADSACNGATDNVPPSQPWDAARYLMNQGDQLCRVDGEQTIGTYTIGFGLPGSFDPDALRRIAAEGDGRYFYASNVDSLNRAFERIILSIAERAVVFGGAGTVQRQGLFSGDTNFVASYRTLDGGSWVGNLKKICVTPPRDTTTPLDSRGRPNYQTGTGTGCMLYAQDAPTATDPDRQILLPNPAPIDRYSNTTSLVANEGGVGARLDARLRPHVGRASASAARDVMTYFPGSANYVPLDTASRSSNPAVNDANLWIPDGDTWKIINRLNGYTYDADVGSGLPTAAGRWPIGDPVNSNPVLIRYGNDCNAAGACTVVVPTNNGLVHFIDAGSGDELAALVPGELWRHTELTHHRLSDLERQPTLEAARRHYIDGPAQLFHNDTNGDGIVNGTDTAYLIFGLGRGGRVLYSMDVTARTAAGTLPPVRVLPAAAGTPYAELRDTWASPWLGRVRFAAAQRNVAIFPSGHIPEMDRPDRQVPSLVPGRAGAPVTRRISCPELAALNGFPPDYCTVTVPAFANPGFDVPLGPFELPDAIAYRVQFVSLGMGPNDWVAVQDGLERWANVVTGDGSIASPTQPLSQPLSGGWSRWVYSRDVSVRLVTERGSGFRVTIGDIEYQTLSPTLPTEHDPSIYVVALDGPGGWNSGAGVVREYSGAPLARITRDCRGSLAGCIDASRPGAGDLAHMTCPVSTEVSVVNFNSDLRLYWGDECGQIFVANNNDPLHGAGAWRVRRLAHLSWTGPGVPDMRAQAVPLGRSRDVRKLYRRLDIVASTCSGARAFGVYFGTGDIQRPLALADDAAPAEQRYLRDPTLSNGRDIMGVIYDTGTNSNVRVANLYNATNDDSASRLEAPRGWYVELAASEKMLRDPLVFQNVVYFKTFQPVTLADECQAGSGVDRSYAMNSCTADAIQDFDGNTVVNRTDRVMGTANEDIGPDPFLITPPDAPPIVVMNSALGATTGQGVHQRTGTARPRIYNWRLPR